MADNIEVKAASTVPVATDVVTYSGDAGQNVQLMRLVGVTGAEGSKTVQDMAVSTAFTDGESNTQTVPGVEAYNMIFNGTTWDRPRGDTTSGLWVNIKANVSQAVTNAGTFAIQDSEKIADDAAFTIGSSKVMPSGGYAVVHGSQPDAADAGDAGISLMNRHRVPFVIGGHPNILTLKHTTITTAVTDAAIITISTGSKIVVTRISVTLDNASTVFPTVLIGFGATNTPTTTGVLYSHGGFPAGGGATIGDGSGMLGVGADNEDLRITTTGNATGNGLQVTVSYYTVES